MCRKLRRAMLAAPKSGSGKTIITCGLLQLLKDRGYEPVSYKCGPDYIDPMFHRRVIGVSGENLDTFFSAKEEILEILASSESETAVLEGVMGIYDGAGGTSAAGSSYDLASVTGTPVIFLMDVKGMGQTMLSVLRGILLDDRERLIKGVILNRMSKQYYEKLSPAISGLFRELGRDTKLLGFLPNSPGIRLESRHLGLKLPSEVEDLRSQIRCIAALIEEHCDVPGILQIMESADDLGFGSDTLRPNAAETPDSGLTLGVARDGAFCFYYRQNLREFEKRGVRIREFSPVSDRALPEGLDGLLLGGGYPELYLKELSENEGMRASVREAIRGGMPSLAECGGFMYLTDAIIGDDGGNYPMAGVIGGSCKNTGRLCRFGYVKVGAAEDGKGFGDPHLLLRAGEAIRGHEFHYYDSTDNGEDCLAEKASGNLRYRCMHIGPEHLWGYPHLYYRSLPLFTERFIERMKTFHERARR